MLFIYCVFLCFYNQQYSYRDTSTSTKSRMVETNPGCPDACYHQNRPEEFYDLFLASSVLKSDEYKNLVEERKRKRKSEEQVRLYFSVSFLFLMFSIYCNWAKIIYDSLTKTFIYCKHVKLADNHGNTIATSVEINIKKLV